ncbi:MAG TPA: alpha/beta hydrolase-fold protein [Solirubrobacteraceae bacterium]|nr:alpha/beta hydrolase-fold protein [Solirubrobacteraceae bacterium]
MRPLRLIAAIALALAFTAAGLAGAYGYGQDYNQHRGFASLVQLPRAGTGRLLKVTFASAALGRRADYLVYLPPGYTPRRRYPVDYLLHGMPGQPRVFVTIANLDVRLDNQLSLGRLRPMILVYPDGRIGQSTFSDSEWANTPSGRFESYVLEVVRNVDRRFSTVRNRRDRVIAGFSAGGYGAMNIALHHLAVFGNVQAWSGYYRQTRSGVFAHASAATLAANSPLALVGHLGPALARHPLRSLLFVGRDDSSSVQQAPMARALRRLGQPVQTAVYPGGHDWSVWYPRLNAMLIAASRATSAPLRLLPTAARAARPVARPHPPRHRARGRARALRAGHHRHHRAGHHRHHRGTQPAPLRRRSSRARTRVGSLSPTRVPRRPARPHPSRRVTLVRRAAAGVPAGGVALLGSLLLALAAAALINLGFVLQHRGLAGLGTGSMARALRSRTWLLGQAVGWIGFAAQIIAVALAPLSLVQAFAAGSFALSTPIAAAALGYRITRAQLIAVGLIALALITLPIGFGASHDHLAGGVLIAGALVLIAVSLGLGRLRSPLTRAVAAGGFYGVADAAIKACALSLHAHGIAGLASGWTLLAGLATFGGFVSFQAALRRGEAVDGIALMNAFTTLGAVVLGWVAFGESLGTSTALTVLHVGALALVLIAVRPLIRGQEALAPAEATGTPGAHAGVPARHPADGEVRSPLRAAAAWGAGLSAGVLVVALALGAGTGLLYTLRQHGLLAAGPRVHDALPLLQLAGFDGQPLARVVAAWLAAGFAAGVAGLRLAPARRLVVGLLIATPLALLASDASFALARNLHLMSVLHDRTPPLGPWLQAALLALGAAVPGWAARRARGRAETGPVYVGAGPAGAAGPVPGQAPLSWPISATDPEADLLVAGSVKQP